QAEQKRGLAHPRLCDQGKESEVRFNAVDQRCQGFAMRRTEIQEAWIGRNPEWLFPKAKEFQKHKCRSLRWTGRAYMFHATRGTTLTPRQLRCRIDHHDIASCIALVATVMISAMRS